jgi:hypothetical protein
MPRTAFSFTNAWHGRGFSFFALWRFALAQNSAASSAPSLQSEKASSPVDQLIPWLLDEDRQLRGLAFSDVILAATGKHVLSFDLKSEVDQRVIKQISGAWTKR